MSDSNVPSMRVCFCHGVSEEEIRVAIRKGADTVQKIRDATKANTGCGGCLCEVERILAEELTKPLAK